MFDPFSPAMHADPYTQYRKLRMEEPVHWSEGLQMWILTRHADVTSVLHNPRFSVAIRLRQWMDAQSEHVRVDTGALRCFMTSTLFYSDPPAHTRTRTIANQAFTPRMAETMRQRIQASLDTLLDTIQHTGRMDLMQDFALPLTLTVGTALMDVPLKDIQWIRQSLADLRVVFIQDIEELTIRQRAEQAIRDMLEYARAIAVERRRSPGDDLFSTIIVAADEQGVKLSPDELASLWLQLLSGRYPNTPNLICNGMLDLFRNPDQLKLLRGDPSLLPQAVEELLRYSGGAHSHTRAAIEDVEIRGKRIRKGQEVLLLLAAANRDPEQFVDPERLDVTRQNNPHLAFSYGTHFCLGAALARVEAQIVFGTLLRRLPGLRLDETTPLEWTGGWSARGLTRLPVVWSLPRAPFSSA